jgi:hypothetical protein
MPMHPSSHSSHGFRLLAALAVLVSLLVGGPAGAQAPAASAGFTPPDDSWAAQLEHLVRWAHQKRAASDCQKNCFVLRRLRLTGDLSAGPISFELEGGVLADGAYPVPLFGPASRVMLDNVKENGKPASIGFENDAYFLHTASRHFVLRGTFELRGDQALAIPGPLNALQSDITGARVVEGSRLSGLTATTIHFDKTSGDTPDLEPTVFQLSRAIRVGREVQFTYALTVRSGTELGVVKLPLRFGERVLEVTGATGWRVEGEELLIPTSGRSVELTITGNLPKVGTHSPDARSGYEWWLFESDPEHRLSVSGDGKQVDAAQSPIPRTQPSARLYLLQRGATIEVSVQTLASTEVLAAIVRHQSRTAVLTRKGDLVFDDGISYENNGIDYLLYSPGGRPIYLATDGTAERIMHREDKPTEVMVPLRTGSHSARVQSLASFPVSAFGGRVLIPMASHPLTASRSSVTVGLPPGYVALAALGGDELRLLVGWGDAVAIVLAFAAAWLALRTTKRRIAGAVVLLGIWFASPPVFAIALCLLAFGGIIWLLSRLLRGAKLVSAVAAIVVIGLFVTLVASFSLLVGRSADYASEPPAAAPMRQLPSKASSTADTTATDDGRTGNWMAQNAEGGVLEGVAPVALPLPSYASSIHLQRELVTKDRPFNPVVYYVTEWVLAPVGVLWLMVFGWLVREHRESLRSARQWVRSKLAKRPDPLAPGPAPAPAPSAPASPSDGD